MDHLPAVFLAGVIPRIGEGRDVLGNPDKQGDEAEAEKQGHPAMIAPVAKINARAPEEEGGEREQP